MWHTRLQKKGRIGRTSITRFTRNQYRRPIMWRIFTIIWIIPKVIYKKQSSHLLVTNTVRGKAPPVPQKPPMFTQKLMKRLLKNLKKLLIQTYITVLKISNNWSTKRNPFMRRSNEEVLRVCINCFYNYLKFLSLQERRVVTTHYITTLPGIHWILSITDSMLRPMLPKKQILLQNYRRLLAVTHK